MPELNDNIRLDGCFNPIADRITRLNETWSDTNLDRATFHYVSFARLLCRACSSIQFEVMRTGSYETSARCISCGMWYIVHTG